MLFLEQIFKIENVDRGVSVVLCNFCRHSMTLTMYLRQVHVDYISQF